MPEFPDRYTHGHHESVLRSHRWRTAQNSAAFLLSRLRHGDSLLDVGCGPGTITADLATLVSPGLVTGIDLSEEVIEVASRETHGLHGGNLRFMVDDVYDLSFKDATFDVVYAHQILQHLSSPVDALVEMRRVLRDGGLLAVRDADFGAFAWFPGDDRLSRWMDLYHQITRANRAEADAGRHLVSWVREAGFSEIEASSSNWTYQRPEDRMWWGGIWADRMRESEVARQGIEYGLTTTEELEEISRAFLDWAANDDGIFIVVNGEVLARR
jgi:ubiquinone/menaquinone biosynthesis C-methylase UbiE